MLELVAVENEYLRRLDVEVGTERWEVPAAWQRGYRTSNLHDWYRDQSLPLTHWRDAFCYRYSWAIPNDEAVRAIAALGSVVEMGAGTGYWARLVAATGADVIAYDQNPPTGSNPTEDGDDHSVIAAKARTCGAVWHSNERPWFPVRQGEPVDLRRHRDRALLLVWPPYGAPMAAECLRYWRGEHLVYVGEDSGGCTGDDEFHDRLTHEFDEVEAVTIPQWDGIHDRLVIYRRRHRPGTPRPLP